MKKFFAIIAVTVLCAVSCTKLGIPTVEFGNIVGNFFPTTESTPVAVRVNIAQNADCKLTIKATYLKLAEEIDTKDIDVTIPAGEREVYVDIPNIEDKEITTIRLNLTNLPNGFIWGGKLVCMLTPSLEEPVIYSFQSETANLHESLKVNLNLTGTKSGKDWKASSKMQFKAILKGALNGTSADEYFVVEEGESTASLTIKADKLYDCNGEITFSVVPQSGLVAGDNETCTVKVMGLPTAKTLAGTWNYSYLIDSEELPLELWYMEDGYCLDGDLVPINNTNFSLNISDVNGKLTLTPSEIGDFANYFRASTMTLCEPVNPCNDSFPLGNYTSEMGHLFVGEVFNKPYIQSCFFELSQVNRAFDKTATSLGKGVISISFVDDDNIIVMIHDYDKPGFATDSWTMNAWDTDINGFASVFTRAK